jgi:hypothetical protein
MGIYVGKLGKFLQKIRWAVWNRQLIYVKITILTNRCMAGKPRMPVRVLVGIALTFIALQMQSSFYIRKIAGKQDKFLGGRYKQGGC